MDRDKNGHDGLNGQEWTAEWTMDDGRWTMDDGRWTMDDGRWTMDRDYVAPFMANPNIADPADQLSVSRPCPVRVKSVWVVGSSPRQVFSLLKNLTIARRGRRH
jgi:hypothetical protein